MAHYVYRVYDFDDRLIYVGCTKDLFKRLSVHGKSSWWAYQIARVRGSVYPDRRLALDAESQAIKTERPRWNVKGRYDQNASWTPDEYVDYATALINHPGSSPSRVRHLHGVGRSYRARFNRRIPLDIPPHPDGPSEDRWLNPVTRAERIAAATEHRKSVA